PMVHWSHSEPIPNSVVKLCYGYDSLGVALRHNRSVPGSLFEKKYPDHVISIIWVFLLLMSDRGTFFESHLDCSASLLIFFSPYADIFARSCINGFGKICPGFLGMEKKSILFSNSPVYSRVGY
uniref:hypothetical protein n=1 Tax=Anabaena azotica TaxID=197653 RepID=UPI001A7ED378